MIVRRDEPNVLRVADNGDIILPGAFVTALLADGAVGDVKGIAEDLEDFGPGRLIVVRLALSDSGTEITIERDRRTEASA
jgi:hypothetical protein